MALFVKSVNQLGSAKLNKEVKQPDNVSKVSQGKINPLTPKESLQGRVTALTTKSENIKEVARVLTLFALFTGAIGLIVPLFLIVALGFLAGVAVCGIESKEVNREAQEAESQLNRLQDSEDSEASLLETEFEKLFNGSFALFEEHGMFESDKFAAMIEKNDKGQYRAFSSYSTSYHEEKLPAYPYGIPEVAQNEGVSLPSNIVSYFVSQIAGLDVRRASTLLNVNYSGEEKQKARHMCAFLKLLGDKNNPVSTDITNGIFDQNPNVTLNPFPLKHGVLTISTSLEFGKSPITFVVNDEEVGLMDLSNPEAKTRYTTSRVVTVNPPDKDGNIAYTITRIFKKI